jgi:hypothetical protein
VERFANLALTCIHQQYPNKISHSMQSDADLAPPRELTPAFYGCYDWHSAVHGHWLLARLARLYPDAPFAPRARAALAESLTPEHVAGEVGYLQGKGRASFERPYGLAWLLQLDAELTEWKDPEAQAWATALAPLAKVASARLTEWLPKLTKPIRIGEHDQTAFALGLAIDWARITHDAANEAAFTDAVRRFYLDDRACPWPTNPPARISCHRASPRPTSSAVCSRRAPSRNGSRRSCRASRVMAAATGSSRESSRTRAIRSWRTWTG